MPYILINEVMYNPAGSDSGSEFVEIYHDGWVNLTGFHISDNSSTEVLIQLNVNKSSNYSLVVESDSILSFPSVSLYTTDATICSGGLNNKETLSLLDPYGDEVDSVYLNDSMANNNGFSIEYFQGAYHESCRLGGTPGQENSYPCHCSAPQAINAASRLSFYLAGPVYVGMEYTNIFKITIDEKENCKEQDTVEIFYSVSCGSETIMDAFNRTLGCSAYSGTGSFTPKMDGNYTICGTIIRSTAGHDNSTACAEFEAKHLSGVKCSQSIDIALDDFIYDSGNRVPISLGVNGDDLPFEIQYWIEDLFGSILKEAVTTTNTNKKYYTPSIDESDAVFVLRAALFPRCNDTDPEDNYAVEYFAARNVKGPVPQGQSEPSIVLDGYSDLHSGKARFGESFRFSIRASRADSQKSVLTAWVADADGNKVSYPTKLTLGDKHKDYSLQMPVQLKENCEGDYDDGSYLLHVEGLGLKVTSPITIEGNRDAICSTKTVEKIKYITSDDSPGTGTKPANNKASYTLVSVPDMISASPFDVIVSISNVDDSPIRYRVFSYVYRSSKCYSASRESNQKELTIDPGDTKLVTLPTDFHGDDGSYKIKVRIFRGDQKTPYEFTHDITASIEEVASANALEEEPALLLSSDETEDSIPGMSRPLSTASSIPGSSIPAGYVIYESSTERMANMLPYAADIVLVLMIISLIIYHRSHIGSRDNIYKISSNNKKQ